MVSYAYASSATRRTHQRLHTRTRAERRAGLVKSDVTVGTNTAEEELDASVALDLRLVVGALLEKIWGVSVQNMNILRTAGDGNGNELRNIDVLEEILVHEGVVALGVVDGEVHVLVHVEGHDVLERNATVLVRLNKSLVNANRRGSSGQT